MTSALQTKTLSRNSVGDYMLDLDRSNAEDEEKNEEGQSKSTSVPKKAKEPLLSKRICSLTKSLNARTQRKSNKRPQKLQEKKQTAVRTTGRTSKTQRRRQTGRTGRNVE
ncbi:unnamed protein product [Ranitomeya imitator]|uniref:Uncharacterized protein n=1 Tax=Ranitomeya imitator TaxID=111125 RepID=A0ABN9KQQ9_9NEOB|nr:unnamed protein product [Ranitomeya imitator]